MSRMLQALKNLDAKGSVPGNSLRLEMPSPRATARPAAPVAPTQAKKSSILQALQNQPVAPSATLLGGPSPIPTPAPALDLPPVARLAAASPHFFEQPLIASPVPATNLSPADPLPPLAGEATALERAARKNLSDVVRAAPYRQLVDRLRQELRSGSGNCLLFTGIGTQSASDEMLLHAAMAQAEAGENVLLIDADLGRGRLSQALDNAGQAGLAEVLSHNSPWRQNLRGTSSPHLFLLPAGQLGLANPSAAADALARLLEQAEREFSLVLVDGGRSGDLLSLSLGRLCDATYFVIRLGSTDALEAQTTLGRYRSLGARVLGCVATNVPLK